MNELQVKITADIANLQSALKKAREQLKQFEDQTGQDTNKSNEPFKRKIGLIESLTNKAKTLRTALSQATNEKDVARYNKELEQTIQEMTRLNALGRTLGNASTGAAGGINKLAQSQGNANGVAIEFNRIIQDSPFGLIGIGNNIQQLTANFAQLQSKTTSAGAAIKASLSALISPANLLVLAISAVTAGFTAYQMGAFDGLFATEDLGKAAEEAAKKLEDYRNSLDAVTKANIEGVSQAQKEIQSFELLRAQAENANIPLRERLEAVKDLKSQYPDYLKGLTDEQILTGNVGNAYKNLTAQIISTAKARAASDAIGENSLKSLTIEERTQERISQILEKRGEIEKANAISEALQGKAGETSRIEREAAIGRAIRLENEILNLGKEQLTDVQDLSKINQENQRLTESINKNISQGARFTEELKTKAEGVGKAFKVIDSNILFADLFKDLPKELENALKGLSNGDTEIKSIDIPINFKAEGDTGGLGLIESIEAQIASIQKLIRVSTDEQMIARYGEQIDELKAKLASFTQDTDNLLGTLVANTLGDVAFAIGDALASGENALQAGGAALLGGIANILNQLGQLAIGTGIAIAGIKKALATLNPVVAIAAGTALVALAGFVSNKARSLSGGGGGFSGGGGVGSSAGAPPQIFTNASASIPNQSGPTGFSGSIDQSNAQGRIGVDIEYDKLRFWYDENGRRRSQG